MNLIQKANQTLQTTEKRRYTYHLSPNSGWSNDPNGLVFFKGMYHVFFQNNPFATNTDNIFWGHFVSKDLITWKQIDFALAPDETYDQNGCFSGSAIVIENKLVLAYAGHRNVRDSYEETICLAESTDGVHFKKYQNNPVIKRDAKISTQRFRDPKIFRKNDSYYILVGSESIEGRGQLLLYRAKNIYKNWNYVGKLINKNKDLGNMIECPDYFSIAEKSVILGSPKGIKTTEKHGFNTLYYIENDFPLNSSLPDGKKIDFGYDFYAPQTIYDPINRRRILIGWFGLPEEQEKEKKHNFMSIGALTLPRFLQEKNEKLLLNPISEMNNLRIDSGTLIQDSQHYSSVSEFLFTSLPQNFIIKIVSPKAEYIINYNEALKIDVHDEIRNHVNKIEKVNKIKKIDLYIDNGLTEVFINDGKYVFTNKCEFSNELISIKISASEKISGINYRLKSIFK